MKKQTPGYPGVDLRSRSTGRSLSYLSSNVGHSCADVNYYGTACNYTETKMLQSVARQPATLGMYGIAVMLG